MLSLIRPLMLGTDSFFGATVLASAGASRRETMTAIALFGFWDGLGSLLGSCLHQAEWHNYIASLSGGAPVVVVGVSLAAMIIGWRGEQHLVSRLRLVFVLPPLFSLDNFVAGMAYPHSQIGIFGDALVLGAGSSFMSVCGFLAGACMPKAVPFGRPGNPALIVSALALLVWTVSH